MAIKLMNGLINLEAPAQSGSAAPASGDSTSTRPVSRSKSPAGINGSEVDGGVEAESGVAPQVHAALQKLKLHSAGRVREEIRDFANAKELANLIAGRITDDQHEAVQAHTQLTPSTAHEYLM